MFDIGINAYLIANKMNRLLLKRRLTQISAKNIFKGAALIICENLC